MFPIVEPRQRPERFTLNRFSPLAESAAFLGLGGFDAAGSVWYPDARRLLGAVPNDGTLTNMDPATDWSRDLGRAVLDFDGSNDYVTFGAPSAAKFTGDCTIAAWWLPTANPDQYDCILSYEQGGAAGWRLWTRDASSHKFYWEYKESYTASVSQWVSGSRVHVCCIRASGVLTIYVNGQAEGTPTAAATPPSYTGAELYFGAMRGSSAVMRFSAGKLSDVVMLSRVASSGEIAALADPSNVMLSVGGVPLILPPHRVSFPAAVAEEPSGFKPYWARPSSQIIGGGIAA